MLDIRLLRDQPDHVKAELAKVGVTAAPVDAVLEADKNRRCLLPEVERRRAPRTEPARGPRPPGCPGHAASGGWRSASAPRSAACRCATTFCDGR